MPINVARANSAIGSTTSNTASDEDAKSVAAMDLSTRKDDLIAPPSTSTGHDLNCSGNSSRSAGRKKTHPVWQFFRDLRDAG